MLSGIHDDLNRWKKVGILPNAEKFSCSRPPVHKECQCNYCTVGNSHFSEIHIKNNIKKINLSTHKCMYIINTYMMSSIDPTLRPPLAGHTYFVRSVKF